MVIPNMWFHPLHPPWFLGGQYYGVNTVFDLEKAIFKETPKIVGVVSHYINLISVLFVQSDFLVAYSLD